MLAAVFLENSAAQAELATVAARPGLLIQSDGGAGGPWLMGSLDLSCRSCVRSACAWSSHNRPPLSGYSCVYSHIRGINQTWPGINRSILKYKLPEKGMELELVLVLNFI